MPLTVRHTTSIGRPPRRLITASTHRLLIVAVHLDRFPAEGFGLLYQRIERRMTVAHVLEPAEIVEVHEGDEIIELEIGRHHHRFPGGAFLEFAVGQDAVDENVGLLELLGVGLAGGHAEPVAERAGGRGDPRRLVIGMGAEPAVRLAVIIEIADATERPAPRGSRTGSCTRDPWTSGTRRDSRRWPRGA